MTYAVKTVKNLFSWCGHERYRMMMENENDFFMKSIIKSYMKGNKCSNVLWYSYWHTHLHPDEHIEKGVYIYMLYILYIYIYTINVTIIIYII